MNLVIRPEQPADYDAVHAIQEAAFGQSDEARLVDLLRAAGKAVLSLVAERDGTVIGHVLFSPVQVGSVAGLGLAPVGVLPAEQGRGVGSALINAGLDGCRALGAPYVVVLGEPDYYRRFGFQRAADFHLGNEYGADEEFRVIIYQPDALPPAGGLITYAAEFGMLEG